MKMLKGPRRPLPKWIQEEIIRRIGRITDPHTHTYIIVDWDRMTLKMTVGQL